MGVDITKELRDRLQRIEIKRAQLEERKRIAEAQIRDAKATLKELGFKPKTAEAELEKMHDEIVDKIEELEELLGLA